MPIADRLFAVAFKVYSTVSCRRFICDMNDAFNRGYMSRRLHHSKMSHYLAILT